MKFSDVCQNKGKRIRMILLTKGDISILSPFWKQTVTRKKSSSHYFSFLSPFLKSNFPLKFGLFLFSAFSGCLKYIFRILSVNPLLLYVTVWKALMHKDVLPVSHIHHTTIKCLLWHFLFAVAAYYTLKRICSILKYGGKGENERTIFIILQLIATDVLSVMLF